MITKTTVQTTTLTLEGAILFIGSYFFEEYYGVPIAIVLAVIVHTVASELI